MTDTVVPSPPIHLHDPQIMSGIGRILVVAVGPNSQSGIIQTLVRGDKVNPTAAPSSNVADATGETDIEATAGTFFSSALSFSSHHL